MILFNLSSFCHLLLFLYLFIIYFLFYIIITIGIIRNIRLFEYSFGGLAFDFQIWDLNILFFSSLQHLASPAKWFSFVFEYE